MCYENEDFSQYDATNEECDDYDQSEFNFESDVKLNEEATPEKNENTTGRKKSRKSPKSMIKYKAEIVEDEEFIEDEAAELVDEETDLNAENQF